MPNPSPQDARDFLDSFGLPSFRAGQLDVIDAVLAGNDCLCIMPTGGGKSLCYQLPAVMRPGVALVISPLIALMKDQVDALRKLNLRATYINSSLTTSQQAERIAGMQAGEFDLVYLAPERFRSPRFVDAVRQSNVQLLAIDEAHCISEWGHDFRPDYARLGWFRKQIGNPPTIALTATATPTVRADVVKQLNLRNPRSFLAGFARPNLRFEVISTRTAKDKADVLAEFLKETPGSGIIYTNARKRCEEVAEAARAAGRTAGVYHAGLMPDERRQAQESFMRGRTEIVVATVAFGMGIDKADVRFVVHYNMPGSIEAYYQEAGRAGRDGAPSRCLLIYTSSDRYIQEYFIDNAYPPPEVVAEVYEYLTTLDDDPIELTQQEIKETLKLSVGAEGVGSCLQLLQKAGAIERLEPLENRAIVRLMSEAPTLQDFLPKTASVQRRVLAAVERIVGDRRMEDFYFHPRQLVAATEMQLPAIARALRELRKLEAFDYVPPFRGRALRVCEPKRDFENLDIDFETYQRRKDAEYAKLDEMVAYATARKCRQLHILKYFGDPDGRACTNCDRCRPFTDPVASRKPSASLLQTIRIALAGVARTQERVGKQMIAQMLGGSRASKITKLKLHELSTFGLLKHLKQSDIQSLLDALLKTSLIEQHDVDRYRPVVRLTELGRQIMLQQAELPTEFPLPRDVLDAISQHDFSVTDDAAKVSYGDSSPASTPLSPSPSSDSNPTRIDAKPDSVAAKKPHTHQRIDPPEDSGRPSYYWTWRLLSAGFKAQECAEIRRAPPDEILADAAAAAGAGLKLDIAWVLSRDELAALETAWQAGVLSAHADPPGGFSIAQVELFLKCRTGRGEKKRSQFT